MLENVSEEEMDGISEELGCTPPEIGGGGGGGGGRKKHLSTYCPRNQESCTVQPTKSSRRGKKNEQYYIRKLPHRSFQHLA